MRSIMLPVFQLSTALSSGFIGLIGLVLYVGFIHLVIHVKNPESRHRWRYSVLWGIVSGILMTMLFYFIFLISLFVANTDTGFIELIKHPKNSAEMIAEIVLFPISLLLLTVPFAFLITLATYQWEYRGGDISINHILYPPYKHPSDVDPDSVSERIRKFIARLL